MNKEQIEKQYLLWNRGQRPTSLTTDFLSVESSIIFFMSGGID
jgi:hypothetical protein